MTNAAKVKNTRRIRVVIPDAKRVGEDRINYSLDELFREYQRVLTTRFRFLTGDLRDGEDLCQNVFERLTKNWAKADLMRIEAFLAVIAHTVYCDWLREQSHKPPLDEVDDVLEYDYHDKGVMDPMRILLNDRNMEEIIELSSLFTDRQKEVFQLFFLDEMSGREVAEATGINKATIYSVVDSIRKLVHEHCNTPAKIEELSWKTSS